MTPLSSTQVVGWPKHSVQITVSTILGTVPAYGPCAGWWLYSELTAAPIRWSAGGTGGLLGVEIDSVLSITHHVDAVHKKAQQQLQL